MINNISLKLKTDRKISTLSLVSNHFITKFSNFKMDSPLRKL